MNLILNTFQQLVLSNPCVKKKPCIFQPDDGWFDMQLKLLTGACQNEICDVMLWNQPRLHTVITRPIKLSQNYSQRAFFSIIVLLTPLQSQTSYVHVILILVFNYKHLTKCVQWSGVSIRSEFANTWWLSWVINTSLNISIDPI